MTDKDFEIIDGYEYEEGFPSEGNYEEDFRELTDEEVEQKWNEQIKREKTIDRLCENPLETLFTAELAEPMYLFVEESYEEEYCNKNEETTLSIAQFVYENLLREFARYCIDHDLISSHK